MTDIYTKVNNLYNNKGFLARYGLDIWTTVIIFIIFFLTTTYFYVLNHIQPIKANWANEKCNPAVIPFAGIIRGKSGKEAIDFTGENFTGCVQTILQNITGYAFAPIYYLMKTYTETLNELSSSVNSIRGVFDKVRDSVKDFSEDTMGRTLNVTAPLVELTITARDILGKTVGTLTATLFTLFGSYLTLQALIGAIMQFVFYILLALVSVIIVSWIVGFFFPPADIIAITTTAAMFAILVPYIIVEVMLGRVMDLPFPSPPGVPSKPSCFSKNTIIQLKNGKLTTFSKLQVGDQLEDDSRITAVLKLSSFGQEIYKLNEVVVSGCHQVFDMIDKKWIYVKNHRDSICIENFDEPYLYCVNTTTKTISVGGNTFLDWDEINDTNITELHLNCYNNPVTKINRNNIHAIFDGGIHEDMKVLLLDGRSVNINEIKVNDILCGGEKVYGIVKIDAKELEGVYEFDLDNGSKIMASKNIFIKRRKLRTINTINLEGVEIKKPEYLYHILTNTGSFLLNGIRVCDYNSCIDMYLDM